MREGERRIRERSRIRHHDRLATRSDHLRKHPDRARDAETSKAALLAAAETIFARDGFEGARVDEIARVAGYNKSLIFQYFGDKLGLYQKVVWCVRDDAGSQLRTIVERFTGPDATPMTANSVREFFETVVTWSFDFFQAHPHILRIHAWEAAEEWHTFREAKGPEGETTIRQGKQWARVIVEYLTRAQGAGYIRPELDPRYLIASVISHAEQYLIMIPRFERIFGGLELSSLEARTHAREQTVALFLHGALVPQDQQDTRETKETRDATGL